MSLNFSPLLCHGGRPVQTNDGYNLEPTQESKKVNLVFADTLIHPGYSIRGNELSGCHRQFYHADHANRTVVVMDPPKLLGGVAGEVMVQNLLRASFGLAARSATSDFAFFQALFLQGIFESTGQGNMDQLVSSLNHALRSMTAEICATIKSEFIRKRSEEIVEESIIAHTNLFNFGINADPQYLRVAEEATDRAYAKICAIESSAERAKFQLGFSAIQNIRYDIHLLKSIKYPNERRICKNIAEETLRWLGDAVVWEKEEVGTRFTIGEIRTPQYSDIGGGLGKFSPYDFLTPVVWDMRGLKSVAGPQFAPWNVEALNNERQRIAGVRQGLIDEVAQEFCKTNEGMASIWRKMRDALN